MHVRYVREALSWLYIRGKRKDDARIFLLDIERSYRDGFQPNIAELQIGKNSLLLQICCIY